MKIFTSLLALTSLILANLSHSELAEFIDTPAGSQHLNNSANCLDTQANRKAMNSRCYLGSLSLGLFMQEEKIHSGLEGSITFDHLENQASRISLGISLKEQKGLLDIFRSISYTHYYHFNLSKFNLEKLNPHMGLGVALGTTNNCSEEREANGKCNEKGLASIYPELGIQIRTRRLTIYPFVRRYDFNDHNTYGLSIGRNF
jgi:hypothetical protein